MVARLGFIAKEREVDREPSSPTQPYIEQRAAGEFLLRGREKRTAQKRADILVINRDTLNQIPVYNIYSDLVYATKAADVESVVINGRIVMRNRRLLTLNETAIKRDARVFRDRIIKSLGTTTAP